LILISIVCIEYSAYIIYQIKTFWRYIMKAGKKTIGNKVYISFLLAATFVLSIYANVSVASDKPVATPHDQLVWVEIAPFVEMADVTGNMGTGAHGTIGKFTPNSDPPPIRILGRITE
jgi:hypothetical protein